MESPPVRPQARRPDATRPSRAVVIPPTSLMPRAFETMPARSQRSLQLRTASQAAGLDPMEEAVARDSWIFRYSSGCSCFHSRCAPRERVHPAHPQYCWYGWYLSTGRNHFLHSGLPHCRNASARGKRARGSAAFVFPSHIFSALVFAYVDSPALLRTTPDRRPPLGQPPFNIHWTGALSSTASPEEDAPRRRGIIRKSNMNPKNIGSCMEGKDEEGGSRRNSLRRQGG